jgi:hypothetical protein
VSCARVAKTLTDLTAATARVYILLLARCVRPPPPVKARRVRGCKMAGASAAHTTTNPAPTFSIGDVDARYDMYVFNIDTVHRLVHVVLTRSWGAFGATSPTVYVSTLNCPIYLAHPP